MSTKTIAGRLLASLLLAMPLLASTRCGDDRSPPPPATPITAARGMPIADAVLLPWMEHYRIPAVSIAVASGDAIDWAKGYGIADRRSSAPVAAETTFQAASISKPIAAVTTLSFFHDRGLDLDVDVAEYLGSWRMPANAFTSRSPVTMRRLLSHSAGFNVHGFLGYTGDGRLPSLVQILDGSAPANNEPIRVTAEPGAGYRYSGGGYQVAQQVLEDLAAGEPYAALAQVRVFDRAGMGHSSLFQPVDAGQAASGHDPDEQVLPGRWHRHPELAAAAVWTTPSDLARFATLLRASYLGASVTLLPPSATREMFARQHPTGSPGEYMGLGMFLAGEGSARQFSHGGGNVGYRCQLVSYLDRPLAIVIMTNSENGDRIFRQVIEAIVAAYSP